jgi:hypothetical protein
MSEDIPRGGVVNASTVGLQVTGGDEKGTQYPGL